MLLELLSEEIPARMQRRAIGDLTGLLRDKLAAAEIPARELCGYVSPRRLAIIARGLPSTQPDRTEERRGPRVGAPPQAVEGFLRSGGLTSLEECEIRDTGRGAFYFAIVKRSGRPTAEVLPDLIKAAITELPWPKSMRWPGSPLRWVRPLTSALCLYDGELLPLALDGVAVGRTTRGHRFLAPGDICVGGAAEYLEKLQRAYVIVDQDRRRTLIQAELDHRATEKGVEVKPDPALLDEVTGLAEFPVVLAGEIDAEYMTLPPEVLRTAMRVHQKYFSCIDSDGRPAPDFLFVANNLADDGGKTIIAGNERVLRARLADARFFWDQDRKIRLEDRVDALKDRVYQARLGSVYDKVQRMEKLAGFLAEQLYPATHAPTPPFPASGGGLGRGEAGLARRAAHLAKADLSTGMVGEFPELQGIMGRYYALHDGEPQEVADAIAEHYRPLGPDDACPTAPESVVVAIADKIDTLVAFFAVDEKPTGSRDPFALRRAAQGIIRLILENELRLALAPAFEAAVSGLPTALRFSGGHDPWDSLAPVIQAQLLAFIVERLRVHLREQGFRHDLIAAALARAGEREDNLVRLLERVKALQLLLNTAHGSDLLMAYRRAASIVNIEERKDGIKYDGDINRAVTLERAETPLVMTLDDVNEKIEILLAEESFPAAMVLLGTLRDPIDEFFNNITVNVEDKNLRENRLRLLARIRATMNRVADFSLIEG
ncbi:MAG TPA: glycine--tRNA ligase subunit beta [Stellaceae bacterium]|nr:glycine--tRNA ligase subunit beta [Stellaceae bacterium]